MIDPIGFRPGFAVERRSSASDKIEAVAAGAASAKTGGETQARVADSGVRTLARDASAKAPIDHERVQQIKRAIAEGRFPIVPARIADRLIAAQMEWVRVDETGE